MIKLLLSEAMNLQSTILFKILIGEMEPDEGTYKWGVTTSQAYFPKDFGGEFDNDYNDHRMADSVF